MATAVTIEDKTERDAEIESTFARVQSELAEAQDNDAYVEVFFAAESGDKRRQGGFIKAIPVTDFDFNRLREELKNNPDYGPGKYTLFLKNGQKRIKAKASIEIFGLRENQNGGTDSRVLSILQDSFREQKELMLTLGKPQPQDNSMLLAMMQMQQSQQQQTTQMMTALITAMLGARKNERDPVEIAIELQRAIAPPKSLKEEIETLKSLRDLTGDSLDNRGLLERVIDSAPAMLASVSDMVKAAPQPQPAPPQPQARALPPPAPQAQPKPALFHVVTDLSQRNVEPEKAADVIAAYLETLPESEQAVINSYLEQGAEITLQVLVGAFQIARTPWLENTVEALLSTEESESP